MVLKLSREMTAGVFFIAAGLFLLSLQLDGWPDGVLGRWWPVSLMLLGLWRDPRTKEGFTWIGSGGIILLWTTNTLNWRDSWPLVLVLHGLALLLRSSRRSKSRKDPFHVA